MEETRRSLIRHVVFNSFDIYFVPLIRHRRVGISFLNRLEKSSQWMLVLLLPPHRVQLFEESVDPFKAVVLQRTLLIRTGQTSSVDRVVARRR